MESPSATKPATDPLSAHRRGLASSIAAAGAWMLGSMLWSEAHPAGQALLSAGVSGLVLILLGMGVSLRLRSWMRTAGVAIGLWMIEAPWILGFAGAHAPALNSVATGVLVVVVALVLPRRVAMAQRTRVAP